MSTIKFTGINSIGLAYAWSKILGIPFKLTEENGIWVSTIIKPKRYFRHD